ncbi:UNVERIFIED_CONTAM: Mss4p nuclear export [Siphonaria sp. JEL0065]|nr:Mss4p nuclear export [Siphonaria sp. JEL0065]
MKRKQTDEESLEKGKGKKFDEESNGSGSEESGNEDEDDEDKEEELIDVDFDFFDPKEIDFHGLKSLIKQTCATDADQFDFSGLAEMIISRPHLGSVVKVDDSQDPYAVVTVLGFGADSKTKKVAAPVTTIKDYLLLKSKKANKENHEKFESLLSPTSKHVTGLLVNERLINMPPQIVVPMLKMLDDELEWSVQEEKEEKEYEYLVYISKTYHEVEPSFNEEGEEVGPSKKKKKKAASGSKVTLNFHVEDEIFEKHEEFHFDFQFNLSCNKLQE